MPNGPMAQLPNGPVLLAASVDVNDGPYPRSTLQEMNEAQPGLAFLPTVKADQLVIDKLYIAEVIKQVNTKFGFYYVVESDTFQLFLPRHFSKLNIEEFMENRFFTITRIDKLSNGSIVPKYNFICKAPNV